MSLVTVNVEVDLSDIETDDLLEELESRGGEGPAGNFASLLDSPAILGWIRTANAPQEVRDLIYEVKGIIV